MNPSQAHMTTGTTRTRIFPGRPVRTVTVLVEFLAASLLVILPRIAWSYFLAMVAERRKANTCYWRNPDVSATRRPA